MEFDFGLGPAAVFLPDEVSALSRELTRITPADLRAAYRREGENGAAEFWRDWSDEDDGLIDEYVIPLFARLQAFYADAATAKQCVLVWHN